MTSEYLTRHNIALVILAVTFAKENKLIGTDTLWFEEQWERGMILVNEKAKLVWDFQFNLRKTETARRPDLLLQRKFEKNIWICDMACPMKQKIYTKR